ncbi:DUF6916 family protein [Shewanella oncorhynchi]|uniref:DUF6916 family protein n=1 Tax=Shewanella oncorhynchi TaxID=2726434 RepID=UPI00374739D9
MQAYTFKQLTALLGDHITLTDSQGSRLQLVIHNVEQGVQSAPQWEAFALYLLGQENIRVPQGNYMFEHPALGAETLFMSPKSQMEYEIVFNRRVV